MTFFEKLILENQVVIMQTLATGTGADMKRLRDAIDRTAKLLHVANRVERDCYVGARR